MLTVIWLFLKTAFSVITSFVIKLIPYILKFWREILIGLVLILYFNEKSSHSTTTQEYALFKQDIQLKADAQALENSIKANQAAKEIQDAQLIHGKQLELLKDAYEKRNQVNVDTIDTLRRKLREQLRNDTITPTEIETDTARTSEEWGNHYANIARKYNTLTHACTITTADYNLLREWSDAACNQIGCEP
jgi:regulator of replication initiation timing